MSQKKAIELTAVFIRDEDNNFTGFFSEFPEAVSQGKTIPEAEKRLFDVLPDIIELKKEMAEEDIQKEVFGKVTKISYSYELAD